MLSEPDPIRYPDLMEKAKAFNRGKINPAVPTIKLYNILVQIETKDEVDYNTLYKLARPTAKPTFDRYLYNWIQAGLMQRVGKGRFSKALVYQEPSYMDKKFQVFGLNEGAVDTLRAVLAYNQSEELVVLLQYLYRLENKSPDEKLEVKDFPGLVDYCDSQHGATALVLFAMFSRSSNLRKLILTLYQETHPDVSLEDLSIKWEPDESNYFSNWVNTLSD